MAPISIEDLKKKRSAAKRKVTLQINDVTPLLALKGKEANENADMFKAAIADLTNRFNAFKLSHEAYVDQLEEETEENELDAVLKKEQDYLNEVNDSYHNTMKKVKDFDKEVTEGKTAEAKTADVMKA